jgi:putative tryptophan/tyrosine transport system substrate-binding protein
VNVFRRRVLFALGAFAGLSARASGQTTGRVYHVAFLGEGQTAARRFELMRAELALLGYREGGNLRIDERNADGDGDRIQAYAKDLAAAKPDVIVGSGARVAVVLAKATQTIPIVIANMSDPVSLGIVSSLTHPGGNLTGLTNMGIELAAKRLDLLKEAFPQVRRVAIWTQPDIPDTEAELAVLTGAAKRLGLVIQAMNVITLADYERAAAMAQGFRAQAIYIAVSPSSTIFPRQIVDLVAGLRLPGIYWSSVLARAGGLMSYGLNEAAQVRRAATYVDRIFNGAKPGDLPIEQPTKLDLIINLKTAKALGLTFPQSLLLRADEVIQ